MIIKNYLISFLLVWVLTHSTLAQSFYKKDKMPRDNSISIGLGPSLIYAETGGQYSNLAFAIRPAFSLAYGKKINPLVSLQATTGMQWIGSGGNPSQEAIDQWLANESAISFSGQAYYLDFMPMLNLMPFSDHTKRSQINFYGGIGIGVMQARTKRYYTLEENSREYTAIFPTAYVPIRAGMSYRISNLYDICLEGSMLLTFSDDLDGNQNWNAFNDHLLQIQLIFKKYLAPKSAYF
ncbi:hypothetical protein EF405_12655 [Cyclobacteriaceae bacterium YHN15]|nr:hypothetical protein EF405_12655 [Cyclobacteriaceae bacterium YHN15]